MNETSFNLYSPPGDADLDANSNWVKLMHGKHTRVA
jgi:hypothetical protein